MPSSEHIQDLRQRGELRQALEAAAAEIDAEGEHRHTIWKAHFCGAEALPWQYARQAVQDRSAGATLERYWNGPAAWVESEDGVGPFAVAMLRGAIRTIQAISACAQGMHEKDYVAQAAAAYQQAFACWKDAWLGRAIVEDIVKRSLHPDTVRPPLHPAAEIAVLLAGALEGRHAWLVAEAVPAESHRLLPDPTRLGFSDLDEEFLMAMKAAWQFTRTKTYAREPVQLRWGWRKPHEFDRLVGPSAGAAMVAVARAALTGERLDRGTAISAILRYDRRTKTWGLGPVDCVKNKCKAAHDAGCDRALFFADPKQPLHAVVADGRHATPMPVRTTDEAFETLLALHRHLGNYQRDIENLWKENWQE